MDGILAMKRPRPKFLAIVFLIIGAEAISAVAGIVPVGQAEFDFFYDRQERLQALQPDRFDYQIGPYYLDSMGGGPAGMFRGVSRDHLQLFAFAAEKFRSARRLRATAFESFRGGFSARPLDRLQVYAAFMLDEELAKDDDYTGKKWRGLAGRVEQAFVNYHTAAFDLTAGRFGAFWGVRRSLIFAPTQNLDGLAYSLRWGRLTLSYRLGRLDGRSPEDESDLEEYENRFVAAHRLDIHIADNLRAGLFETILFGGAGRQIDLFYLNPLIFFHGSQLNEGTNDNSTVGADFDWQPARGYNLFGQILVDDIQIDDSSDDDKEPAQIAFIVGVYRADLLDKLDIMCDYTRVNNWTFNQVLPRNRYLNDNRPLGEVRGNDYDLIRLTIRRWLGDDLHASLNLSHIRQGEGRIDAIWDAPWLGVEGDYSEPFPTGVVEKTSTASLGLKGFPLAFVFVDLEVGVDFVSDRLHVEGADDTRPFVRLYVSGFLNSPVRVD